MQSDRYPLLSRIESPVDLRCLPQSELPEVVRELREFLIESVSESTGHFAAASTYVGEVYLFATIGIQLSDKSVTSSQPIGLGCSRGG